MSLVCFDDVQKTYRSLQGADYVAVERFSIEIAAAGQIRMEGRPVTGASRDRGVVFQGDDSLYGWLTAVENVEFGLRMRGVARSERRERALRYLELVGLKGQEG